MIQVFAPYTLDDLEVARVRLYRNAVPPEIPGLVYLGTAVFIEGARPDVERAFRTMPLSQRAGWGFLILTNTLPNQGNGGFRIHAIAKMSKAGRPCWVRARFSDSMRRRVRRSARSIRRDRARRFPARST